MNSIQRLTSTPPNIGQDSQIVPTINIFTECIWFIYMGWCIFLDPFHFKADSSFLLHTLSWWCKKCLSVVRNTGILAVCISWYDFSWSHYVHSNYFLLFWCWELGQMAKSNTFFFKTMIPTTYHFFKNQ